MSEAMVTRRDSRRKARQRNARVAVIVVDRVNLLELIADFVKWRNGRSKPRRRDGVDVVADCNNNLELIAVSPRRRNGRSIVDEDVVVVEHR